jgi:hypothetical protein
MKTILFVFSACLVAAGCDAPAEQISEEEISLLPGKEDRLGNRSVDTFGGVLHYDDAAHSVDLPTAGYKAGFTFRAVAGKEFKLSARVSGGKASATLKLYGPKSARTGNYPYVATASTYDEGGGLTVDVLYHKARAEGIYLAVLSTSRRAGGVGEVHLNCGNGDECELGCAVVRLWDPQCGVDGVTYGNQPSAACFDVPIAHRGECEVIEPPPPGCELIDCGPNKLCQMQEIVCITEPCNPVPVCVCASLGLCVDGYKWSDETCQCEPAQTTCVVTGCSGQVCAAEQTITTCEWLPQYACYADATCAVQPDGHCGWTETVELTNCLEGAR